MTLFPFEGTHEWVPASFGDETLYPWVMTSLAHYQSGPNTYTTSFTLVTYIRTATLDAARADVFMTNVGGSLSITVGGESFLINEFEDGRHIEGLSFFGPLDETALAGSGAVLTTNPTGTGGATIVADSDDVFGWGDEGVAVTYFLESITFSDGTVLNVLNGVDLWGTPGDDVITGFDTADSTGQAYHDTLSGFGGDDRLRGGDGNDLLEGGIGDDELEGEAGNDLLLGDEGDDTLWGGAGTDTLDGGAGQDNLWAGEGEDTLSGGVGNDVLVTSLGADTFLYARGDGHDRISATGLSAPGLHRIVFDDSIAPGDVVLHRTVSNNFYNDLYVLILDPETREVTGSIQINNQFWEEELSDGSLGEIVFSDGTVWDLTGGLTLSALETTLSSEISYPGLGSVNNLPHDVRGTAYGDFLVGSDGADTLWGVAGMDTLSGGVGNDVLSGGPGSDFLDGGPGADRILGGQGNDSLLGREGDDSVDGGDNHDNIALHGGDDSADGGLGNDSIGGGDGADSLRGESGNDVIGGGAGNDFISAGADQDAASGGTGEDTVLGGAGDDTLAGSYGDDRVEGDEGDDSLGGGPGADTLAGGDGEDSLGGGFGGDLIAGDAGADFLAGGAGDDQLLGGDGEDTLNGGEGRDTLVGGSGADVFVFSDMDRIQDFEDGVDVIRLSGVGPAALSLSDVQDGVLVAVNGASLIIEGLTTAEITQDDFIFV